MTWRFLITEILGLAVVLLSLGSWTSGDALAAENRTFAAVEQLREQLQDQNEQIEQLRDELVRQRNEIRRLPGVADADDTEPRAAGDGQPEGDKEGAERETSDQTADNDDLLNRVAQLEESMLGSTRGDNEFLETPSLDSSRVVNGRIHIDQWGFPEDSSGVNEIETGDPLRGPIDRLMYRRLRIGVGGKVPPGNMSYRLEIEYSGQDGSQFRDAWIGWDDLAFFGTVRLGNQKRPYGWDHLNSSNFNLFMERPFIVEALNEDNRRFGLATYGVSDNLAFNWRAGVFDINLIQDAGSTLSDKYPLEVAGRMASTYWYDEVSDGRGYAHVALAGTCAFPSPDPPEPGAADSRALFRARAEGRSTRRWLDTGRINGVNAYQILGIESVINVGPFQCGGEFMNLWLQRKPQFGSDMYMHGGYVYASYFLTGEHIPWNRELGILGRVKPFEDFFSLRDCRNCISRGTGAWELATRLSYGDLTDQDVFGGVGQSATFALNWYWNDHARLQWNYIFGRIDDRQVSGIGDPIVAGSYQISGLRGIIDF